MEKMGRLIIGVIAALVAATAFAQQPATTINGTPPPYTFTGAGVSQTGQTFTFAGAGSGTVTSVALKSATPNLFSGTAGTAVTTSGFLDPDAQLLTQSANCIVAGPSTGAAAAPTCRALVNADFPSGLTFQSPIFVTPALGTPASGVITNLTGACTACTANAAGSVTNALTLNNSNSGAASGTTYNGSAAVTLSANTLGAGSLANADTWSAAQTISVAGAASTSPLSFTGALLTGGTGTTNFPHLFFQPTGTTAATTWSTNGTTIGINAANGFTGNYLDFRTNGSSSNFSVSNAGTVNNAGNLISVGTIISGTSVAAIGSTAALAFRTGNAGVVSWTNAGAYNGTQDTGLDRQAAGIVEVNLGTAQGSGGSLKLAGLMESGGTAFTVSGCGTAGSITGGAAAGSFTVGTGTTNCTFTVTVNGATGLTAPHGWIANADDTTANIHCVNSTTVSATTAVFVCTGTISTSDLIKFSLVGY